MKNHQKHVGEKQAKLPLGKFFLVKIFFLKVFLFYKRECDLIMVGGCEDSQRAPKVVQYDQVVNDEMWEMCAESPPNLYNFKQICRYVRHRLTTTIARRGAPRASSVSPSQTLSALRGEIV